MTKSEFVKAVRAINELVKAQAAYTDIQTNDNMKVRDEKYDDLICMLRSYVTK